MDPGLGYLPCSSSRRDTFIMALDQADVRGTDKAFVYITAWSFPYWKLCTSVIKMLQNSPSLSFPATQCNVPLNLFVPLFPSSHFSSCNSFFISHINNLAAMSGWQRCVERSGSSPTLREESFTHHTEEKQIILLMEIVAENANTATVCSSRSVRFLNRHRFWPMHRYH